MDRFAKGATLFTQAITQGSKTPLALPSLHTSTYPRAHGIYREGYQLNTSVVPTLSQILKKNNYTTAAIVCCIKHYQGLERGFDLFMDDGDIKSNLITQRAISWLEKNCHNKFFLWLHYYDPHGPYRPPPPYNRMFIDNFNLGRRHVPIGNKLHGGHGVIPLYVAEGSITDVDYYISQYDGEIRYLDEQIGILLRKIEELNLDEKSIVIITADHGELLGEHENYFGHNTLYDEIIRVPLLIKYKKMVPASKAIKKQIQSIDIVPTILALLHISRSRNMQGESLLPLIFGNSSHPSVYAFSEHARVHNNFQQECVRAHGWKLIYTKGYNDERYELYNLNLDPTESNNLINVNIEKFKFLKQKLDNWRRQIPISQPKVCYPLTEEIKRVLRSLGYLQ